MMTGTPNGAPPPRPEDDQSLEAEVARLREDAALRHDIDRVARHDLKAPLALILQAAELLLDAGDTFGPDDRRKYTETIRNAGQRMLDLLDLSHALADIESGTFRLRAARVNLLAILDEVADRLRVLIKSQRSEIRVTVDGHAPQPGDEVPVRGDRLLTFAILANLIKNAFEASPRGQPVTVQIENSPHVHVAIANAGAVPEPARARFFQKHNTHGKAHGIGLGAYFARRCTEAQGGTIRLDTAQPDATTIHVTLPLDTRAV